MWEPGSGVGFLKEILAPLFCVVHWGTEKDLVATLELRDGGKSFFFFFIIVFPSFLGHEHGHVQP